MLETHFLGRPDIADLLDSGIRLTFARGYRTADVASPGMMVVGTQEITQQLIESLNELKKHSFLEAGQG